MGNDSELNQKLLREMFNTIRNAEIRNIKTQTKDDKSMANSIEHYISRKVKEEAQQNED